MIPAQLARGRSKGNDGEMITKGLKSGNQFISNFAVNQNLKVIIRGQGRGEARECYPRIRPIWYAAVPQSLGVTLMSGYIP
jgi:hypothetical protein